METPAELEANCLRSLVLLGLFGTSSSLLACERASSFDYVLPPNQAWAPFTKTRTVLLPDRLFEEHDLTQSRCTMGLLPEIERSWVTVDHRLLLWDWADGQWVVLTNMGANVVSRQRPVDTLLDVLKSASAAGNGGQGEIGVFFESYGRDQSCAMLLTIAAGNSQLLLADSADVSTGMCGFVSTNARTRPVSIDRGGYGSGPQGQASDSKIIFSGRHEGLAFYFARLIRPIWKQKITRPSPSPSDPSRQGTNVPDVVLSAVQRDLIALRSFVEQEHLLFTHVPDSSRSSPNSAAYQAEQASLASLHLLLTQSVEAISFILLLNDYQIPEIAASCASERQLSASAVDTGMAAGELLRDFHHRYKDLPTLSSPVLVGPAALALHALERPRLDLTCLKELHVPTSLMHYEKTGLLWYHAQEGHASVESQIRPELRVTDVTRVCYSDDLLASFPNPTPLLPGDNPEEQDRITVLCGPAHAILLMMTWLDAHRNHDRDRAFLALHTLLCLKMLHTQEFGLGLSLTFGSKDRFELSADNFRTVVRGDMLHLVGHLLPELQSSWFARIDMEGRPGETPEELDARRLEAQMRRISPLAEKAAAWEAKKWAVERWSPRDQKWREERAARYQDMFNQFAFLLYYAGAPRARDTRAEEENPTLETWTEWERSSKVPHWTWIHRAPEDQPGDAAHSLAKLEYVPQARTGWAEASHGW
ncbi:hypothetical protein JCM1840_004558 [Sporobolomyces johnsonii]